MLVELSVSPKSKLHEVVGIAVDPAAIADTNGLHCEQTPHGAILEGEWEPLMAAVKKWHDEMLRKDGSVTTVIRAVDSSEIAAHLHPAGVSCSPCVEKTAEDDGEWLMF